MRWHDEMHEHVQLRRVDRVANFFLPTVENHMFRNESDSFVSASSRTSGGESDSFVSASSRTFGGEGVALLCVGAMHCKDMCH